MITLTAKGTRLPDPKSDLVLVLKQGDFVDILETNEAFVRIRYKIDGDFPVEAWFPKDALKLGNQTEVAAARKEALYAPLESPLASPPKTLEAESFPETRALKRSLNLPPSPSTSSTAAASTTLFSQEKKASPRPLRISGWYNDLEASLGIHQWSESLKTQKADGSYYDTAFLKYDLNGIFLSLRDELGYALPWGKVGAQGSYSFTYFSDSVTPQNEEIAQSSIQAQFHEIQISGFVRKKPLLLPRGFQFEPEAHLIFGAQIFQINQLRDISPTNPNRLGQPVLMNLYRYSADLKLMPSFRMPYRFTLSPELGLTLMAFFYETPTLKATTEAESIRTGTPQMSSLLLSYGAKLRWQMDDLGMSRSELFVDFSMRDLSRKYSGEGNRAGMKTKGVQTSNTLMKLALGYQYQF